MVKPWGIALYTKAETNELLDALSWRLLLPDLERPRVLSVCPPDAAHAHALATLFGDVASVDLHSLAASKDKITARTAEVNSPQINADVSSLPFNKNSYELVIMNTGGGRDESADEDPRTYYESLFASLYRTLTDGGCVCLCVSNRWDYRRYQAGAKQESGISGRLSAVLQTYRRQRELFLSPMQYTAALQAAGFSKTRSYVAFPNCTKPRFVVPFDAGAYRYYRNHFTYPQGTGFRNLVAKLIAGSGLDRFLESHLLITGVKC